MKARRAEAEADAGGDTSGSRRTRVGMRERSETHSPTETRLRATEGALRAAQQLLAERDGRERELRQLLVASGLPDAASSDPKPTRGGGSRERKQQQQQQQQPSLELASDAKMQALKTVHDQKVRQLMRSINQLQEQIQSLKGQDKEHRRSVLIQNLRKSQREQELIIDVLKQTLLEKVPEFQESKALVNDYIVKKTVGGPLRFRPKTREELESELDALDGKYKRVVENLKRTKDGAAAHATETPRNRRPPGSESKRAEREDDGTDQDDDEGNADADRARVRPISMARSAAILEIDPAPLQEEIERLKVELAAENLTHQSQADEINELYGEIERLRVAEEKLERKRDKIVSLEEKLNKLQLELVQVIHEKEGEAEKCAQLREELQFVRDTRIDDVSAGDAERLRQLELVQSLRAREVELQRELEEQQRKWSVDRAAINQQMRLLEKEKQLLEDRVHTTEDELRALQKKHDRLFAESEATQRQLAEVTGAKEALASRIQELEGVVSLHESMTRDEREAHARTLSERVSELEASLAAKDEVAKKLDRQLNASKLLARQANKKRDQLQERCAKLQEALAVARQHQESPPS